MEREEFLKFDKTIKENEEATKRLLQQSKWPETLQNLISTSQTTRIKYWHENLKCHMPKNLWGI